MLCQEKSDGWMESERKPFTQTSKERMKNKIRCAGQDYLATLQASQLECDTLLLAVGLSHNKDNEKPCPFGIRCAASRASSNPLRFFSLLGCRPIRIKRKDDSLVNKFPILSSFLFILTRLVAYPKYLSSNPLRALPCLASSLAIS